jgi:hypothetical protein
MLGSRFSITDQPLPDGRGSVSRNRAATVRERLVIDLIGHSNSERYKS